ncbi:MAG: hypothetical protein QXV17_09865 [Candidatus Micrarchaeaceae archaeon]
MVVEGKGTIKVHACGHNLNLAAAVGAAISLKKMIKNLSGGLVILGTPAEKGGGGKIASLKEGLQGH